MFKLEFTPDEQGRKNYEILIQSILMTDRQVQVSEQDDCMFALRKLKQIGTQVAKTVQGIPIYSLGEDGGTVLLERSEQRFLDTSLKQPIWRPHVLDDVSEVKKWFNEIKEVKGSVAPDAKQDEKRAGELLLDAQKSSLDSPPPATADHHRVVY